MNRSIAAMLLVVALASPAGGLAAQAVSGPKLFYGACPPFQERMAFQCYHSYDEVTAFLREAARRYPNLARLESMGKSYQGRDLWVLTVTDFAAGDPLRKPGVWVDAGIDADEVVATEAALGVIHRLLTSTDPKVADLRRTRAFYIAPVVIPDASELHHTTPIRPRDTTLRPWDDDNDGELDEDGPEDLDGDGQALQMRIPDPDGGWVRDRDPRLMRARRAGDTGPFYRVVSEGIDNDGDGEINEDPAGGIDPNRNYPGNWSSEQTGNGPFAGSELELRAMLDFALAHPNIAASQHFHSSGGVVLRPPSVPDLSLPPADERLYLELSRLGLQATGYDLATPVYDWNWPRGSRNTRPRQIWRERGGELRGGGAGSGGGYGDLFAPAREIAGEHAYPAYGGSIDAMYLLFGVLAFANEIYQMGQDDDGDGLVEPEEQLAFNDRSLRGEAFRAWTRHQHPALGPVEIGGWKKFGHNNPLPQDLPREVERNVEFVLVQAAHTQLLAPPELEVKDLGGGVHRVRATIRNVGYAPTELAIREQQGRAAPVLATLAPGEGVELLSARSRENLGVIPGHSAEEVEWLVRAPSGGTVRVTVAHPKAGTAAAEARLASPAR